MVSNKNLTAFSRKIADVSIIICISTTFRGSTARNHEMHFSAGFEKLTWK